MNGVGRAISTVPWTKLGKEFAKKTTELQEGGSLAKYCLWFFAGLILFGLLILLSSNLGWI